jgi:hypothetical protein
VAQVGDARRGERAERCAVVGDLTGDHLVLGPLAAKLEVLARELERRFDRLTAAAAEEHATQVARSQRRDPRRELDRGRMRIGPVGEEPEFPRLVRARLGNVSATVPDVHAEQRGEPVEVAVAVLVVDVATLPANDDRDVLVVVGSHPREVHPQMPPGKLLQRL